LGGGPKNVKEFYALPVFSSAAYIYGLQRPQPFIGYIKTKTKNTTNFSFPHNNDVSIASISLITGEDKKQEKAQAMNFTDNGGVISFNHQFKKEDTHPVRIVADGKVLIQYFVEVVE
jgi:hypothetical protein